MSESLRASTEPSTSPFTTRVQLLEVAYGNTTAYVVERKQLVGTQAQLALQLLTLVGNLASLLLGIHHVEGITGLRGTVQAQYLYRGRRTGRLDAGITLVEHRLHTAVVGTGQHHIALVQGSFCTSTVAT